MTRVLAFLLIAEAIFNGLYVAGLIGALPGHDTIVVVFIFARGILAALQFSGGWTLAERRPSGIALARTALVAGALLTTLDVGLNLAPTSVPYWYRWHATTVYWVYALVAVWYLSKQR